MAERTPPDGTTERADQAEQSAMDRLTRLGLMTASSRHLVDAMLAARDEELERLRATPMDWDAQRRRADELEVEVERLRAELASRCADEDRTYAELESEFVRTAEERDALKAAIEKVLDDPIMNSPLGEPLVRVDDIRTALTVPESNEDAEDTRWRQDEKEITGGFTGNEFPRLWPPRRAPESNEGDETENADG